MYKIRYFFRRLRSFPRRIKRAWPFFKFYFDYDLWDARFLIINMLGLQLRLISKEVIKYKKYKNYGDKKRDLKLLWQCRKALENYRDEAGESMAYEIDKSLFKNKFKIDMPKATFTVKAGKIDCVTYHYPDAIDEETKKQIEEYLHSKERLDSLVQNLHSANSAYLQDFLNKLGTVIDSFEY